MFLEIINRIFLINYFESISSSTITYKCSITLFLTVLMFCFSFFISYLFPGEHFIFLLIRPITVWIQMLLLIIILFCNNKTNNNNITLF
jgi:hypothetical protein